MLTSESWGKRETNATNSSHPQFRLIGLGVPSLRALAPSLRALTSSNIVPASRPCVKAYNHQLGFVDSPFDFSTSSVRARIAAKGVDICDKGRNITNWEYGLRTYVLILKNTLVCGVYIESSRAWLNIGFAAFRIGRWYTAHCNRRDCRYELH